jgi:hypothetical protein
MGTIAITSSGFAPLPPTAPDNWPSNLVWPAGGSVNGTKNYTLSDTDAQQMLSWIGGNYNDQLIAGKTPPPPYSISALQIYLVWLNGFMSATTDSVQRYHTTPPAVPPPISIS